MKLAGLDISGLKVGAIINTSSGGCDSESEAEMLDILNHFSSLKATKANGGK